MIALPFHPSNAWTIHEFLENAADILAAVEADAQKRYPKAHVKLTDKIHDGGVWADQGVIAGCAGGTYSNITDYKDRTFASGTLELSHNADGTKSFTVAAFSGWLYGNGDYTAAAKSFTLPTIPRATTPAIGPVTIGGKATISLPRASASFTHTLTYTFGSASGTIATKVGSSYTWTSSQSLAKNWSGSRNTSYWSWQSGFKIRRASQQSI